MAGDIDFGGGKAINVGDPRYSQDGVNLRTLLRIIELSGGGASSITGTVISISQGTNILTGGTVAKPTISTTLTPTFTSVYATTLSGGTIFSAGTNLSSLFINTNQRTFVQEGSNIYTGGTDYRPSIHINDSPSFNTIRASGTTYGNIVSGNTYYSGSTLLSNIIYSLASGSTFLPTTLIAFGSSTSGLTYDFGFSYNLSQNLFTIDGYTYVGKMASGVGGIQSTQNILGLYGFNSYSTIFLNSLGGVASDIQHFSTEGHYFSNGSHKSAFLNWSGVSLSYPALYMFDSITSITPNALNYTMASDGVNLYINSKNSGGRIQFAAGGTETGSINNGSAFFNSNVVSPVMSAYTMTSSTFVINTVAANYGAEYYNSGVKRWSLNVDGNDYFRLHPWNASPFGSNDIFFAGSALGVGGVPTHNLTVYGSARTHSLSATTISADTIYVSIISASTLSANTIQSSSLVGSTGRINSWTATTLSGGTIYSGSSDLSLLFMGAGAIPAIPLNKNEIAFGSNSNVITSNNTLKYINPNLFLTGNSNDELSLFVVNKSGTTSSVAAISLMNENDGAGKISKLSDLFTVVNTISPGDFLIYNSGSTGNINILNANASGEIVMAAGGSVTNHFKIGTTGDLFSGASDMNFLFAHAGKIGVTSIGSQNSNITTGGTVTNPTVLLASSPNLNGINLSGSGISARALSFSATTLSGRTIYSGSSDLSLLFMPAGVSPSVSLNKNEIAFGSNSNIITSSDTLKYINPNLFLTGNSNDELSLFVVNKSGTTSSVAAISLMNENDGAGKISKLSDLFTVVNTINPGDFLIYNSGSTGNINLLNANASGEIVMAAGGSVTNHFRIGTTGVLYSGGTDLDSVFAHAGKIGVTSIGSQNSNITTGGTVTNPTVLLAASPNLNGITLSGSGISARALSFSATTLSGGTLYSGSTNLYSIFQKLGSTTITGATNLGAAQEVFKATNGQLLEFRTLSGSNLNVRTDSDNIIIGSSNIKTTSSNSSIDIDFTDYVYNGGAGGATWTLPGTVPNNVKWKLLNIGAGNVTLNTGGGNDIYDMVGASTTNTASILQNEAYQIVANGTYFILIKLN